MQHVEIYDQNKSNENVTRIQQGRHTKENTENPEYFTYDSEGKHGEIILIADKYYNDKGEIELNKQYPVEKWTIKNKGEFKRGDLRRLKKVIKKFNKWQYKYIGKQLKSKDKILVDFTFFDFNFKL